MSPSSRGAYRRRETLKTEPQWKEYLAEIEKFNKSVDESKRYKSERREKLVALYTRLADGKASLKDKLEIMEQTHAVIPNNRNIIAALAFYSAAAEDWTESLEYIRAFLQTGVRLNARSMSMGLLEACILNYLGEEDAAREALKPKPKKGPRKKKARAEGAAAPN